MRRNVIARSSLAAFTAWGLCATACDGDRELARGQLIVALSSDMSVTKDLDEVRVQVFRPDGTALPDRQIPLIPAEPAPFGKALPGTLAIVPADAGGQQVRIVVTARRLDPSTGVRVSRVVREAIVKIPTDRSALLSMPLRWLCTDRVTKVDGTEDSFRSDCAENETCVAGSCRPADVDADALPEYTPGAVFGGGDETGQNSRCLEVQSCFSGTSVLAPDADDCSIPLPDAADLARLNVALVLDPQSDGHCLEGGNCYLPLDADPDEGFRVRRGKIELPRVACERQGVIGVAVSTACETKDLSIPVCGPWTGWPRPVATGRAGSASVGSAGTASSSGGAANMGTGGRATSAGGPGVGGGLGFAGSGASGGRAPNGGGQAVGGGPVGGRTAGGTSNGGTTASMGGETSGPAAANCGPGANITFYAPGQKCVMSWQPDATGMQASLSFEIDNPNVVTVEGVPLTLPPDYAGPLPAPPPYAGTFVAGDTSGMARVRVKATHSDSSSQYYSTWTVVNSF